MYYLNARYYDSEIGRFISSDDVAYIDPETIGGVNLFAYCNNNPVMNSDPYGNDWNSFWKGVGDWFSKNLATVVDIAITAVAGVAALASGLTGGPLAAVSTFGSINNAVNSIYYNFFADSVPLNESRTLDGQKISEYVTNSGGFKYINRWDRLNHTKALIKESTYNSNAWRYNSEYSAHMWGWLASTNFDFLSNYKTNLMKADVSSIKWDKRSEILIPTILLGILGI